MGVRTERLVDLAERLAERDRELGEPLGRVWGAVRELRDQVAAAADVFRGTARERGAEHLANLEVGPAEPDEKHVDCVQFRIARGRFEALCVGKAKGSITLVGPYKRGKPEKPCVDFPLGGPEVERGLEELLLALLEAASGR
jgi:hypothetical protein